VLRKIFQRFAQYARSFRADAGESRFMEANRAFWSRYWAAGHAVAGSDGSGRGGRWVLIEATSNPIINLCNASFGAIACHARELRPVFLLYGLRDRSTRRMLASYHPGARFVFTTDLRYLVARFAVAWQALRAWSAMRGTQDVLDFRLDGMRFGDIVYDNALVLGYATLRKADWKVLAVLYTFFLHRHIIRDLMRRYPLDSCVVSHTIGMLGGVFTRYLVNGGIEVINRAGSHEIHLKKFQSAADIGFYPAKPERRYFDLMMSKADEVLPLAEKYLDDRHGQQVNHIAVELAFSRNKRLFSDRGEFCRVHDLDPDKKIVFVMLHAFNDHPHSHFARPLMFRDYFDWFERTLLAARGIDSVNWVFKEHPAASFYPVKDVDVPGMFRQEPWRNIVFLDAEADFNGLSIRYLADVIVTCLGTAGMEYSCVGIPCLLGGESPYSGFGFTDEPADVPEYLERLRAIDRTPGLDANQIKAAKIVMFFELPMMHSVRYRFCPHYSYQQIKEIIPSQVLADAAELMRDGDEGVRRAQVAELADFLRNPRYTQYVNLSMYAFLREAVPTAPV